MNDDKYFKIIATIILIFCLIIGYSVGYHFGGYLGHDLTRRVEQVQNN